MDRLHELEVDLRRHLHEELHILFPGHDRTVQKAINRLHPMEQDGLVALIPDAIAMRPPGCLLVRNVTAAFDAFPP